MNPVSNLRQLLSKLSPTLVDGEFVFLTLADGVYGDAASLEPIATFQEQEGLTMIVPRASALSAGQKFDSVFRMITLQVHSSLGAVGLTAAVARKLAEKGISANVVAAFHHDHIFVPTDRASDTMAALDELQHST